MNKLAAVLAVTFLIAGGFALYGQTNYSSIKSELDRMGTDCAQRNAPSLDPFRAPPYLPPICGPTFEEMNKAEETRNVGVAFAVGAVAVWLLVLLWGVASPRIQKGAKVGGRMAVDAGRVAVDELSKRSARATKDVVGAVVQISDSAQGRTRECPFCAEMIKPQAKVCRHCGKDVA